MFKALHLPQIPASDPLLLQKVQLSHSPSHVAAHSPILRHSELSYHAHSNPASRSPSRAHTPRAHEKRSNHVEVNSHTSKSPSSFDRRHVHETRVIFEYIMFYLDNSHGKASLCDVEEIFRNPPLINISSNEFKHGYHLVRTLLKQIHCANLTPERWFMSFAGHFDEQRPHVVCTTQTQFATHLLGLTVQINNPLWSDDDIQYLFAFAAESADESYFLSKHEFLLATKKVKLAPEVISQLNQIAHEVSKLNVSLTKLNVAFRDLRSNHKNDEHFIPLLSPNNAVGNESNQSIIHVEEEYVGVVELEQMVGHVLDLHHHLLIKQEMIIKQKEQEILERPINTITVNKHNFSAQDTHTSGEMTPLMQSETAATVNNVAAAEEHDPPTTLDQNTEVEEEKEEEQIEHVNRQRFKSLTSTKFFQSLDPTEQSSIIRSSFMRSAASDSSTTSSSSSSSLESDKQPRQSFSSTNTVLQSLQLTITTDRQNSSDTLDEDTKGVKSINISPITQVKCKSLVLEPLDRTKLSPRAIVAEGGV